MAWHRASWDKSALNFTCPPHCLRLMSPPICAAGRGGTQSSDAWSEKFESLERINSMHETNGSLDSWYSCKRLVPSRSQRLVLSRLHEFHESKLPFVSRIEFIRSKLSNLSAHVSGVSVLGEPTGDRRRPSPASEQMTQMSKQHKTEDTADGVRWWMWSAQNAEQREEVIRTGEWGGEGGLTTDGVDDREKCSAGKGYALDLTNLKFNYIFYV